MLNWILKRIELFYVKRNKIQPRAKNIYCFTEIKHSVDLWVFTIFYNDNS